MKFNNFYAVLLTVLIVTLWILQGTKTIDAMPEVSGATIATFTLIVQFYFRKSPPTPPTTPTGGAMP